MNLISVSNDLKGLSDQQLHGELMNPSGMAPSFLVLGELTRRKDSRSAYAARAQAPSGKSMAEEMTSGLGAAQSPYAQAVTQGMPGQPPQGMNGSLMMAPPGAGEMPQQGPSPAAQGFASGGGVAKPGKPDVPGQSNFSDMTPLGFGAMWAGYDQDKDVNQYGYIAPELAGLMQGESFNDFIKSPMSVAGLGGMPAAVAGAFSGDSFGKIAGNVSGFTPISRVLGLGFAEGGPVDWSTEPTSFRMSAERGAYNPEIGSYGSTFIDPQTGDTMLYPFPSIRQKFGYPTPPVQPVGATPGTYQYPLLQRQIAAQDAPGREQYENPNYRAPFARGDTLQRERGLRNMPGPESPPSVGTSDFRGAPSPAGPPEAPMPGPLSASGSQGYGGPDPMMSPAMGLTGAAPPPAGPPAGGPPAGDPRGLGAARAAMGPGSGAGGPGANRANQSLSDFMAEIRGQQMPDRYGELSAQNAEAKEKLRGQAASDKGMALLQAGLAIAGGTSPYAITNIGQGGQAGVKYWNDAQKEVRIAERDLRTADQNIAVAQAKRDEGQLEKALTLKVQAENNYQKSQDRLSAAGIAGANRSSALELKKMELDSLSQNRTELQEQHRLDSFRQFATSASREADTLDAKAAAALDPASPEVAALKQQSTLLRQQAGEYAGMYHSAAIEREIRLGNLKRVATPEEASKLPKGTRVLMPDGNIGIVK